MKKTKMRIKDNRWCEVEVRLEDGSLSITGSEGRLVPRDEAKEQAKQYWVGYFDDDGAAIIEMNRRCGSKCADSESAAEYVLQVDGEFHGLDVHGPTGDDPLMLLESCGQIREALAEFFPEVEPYFKWHLNDMKASCEHQEALGWGHEHDVAIMRQSVTQAQRTALYNVARAAAEREVDQKDLAERKALFFRDPSQGRVWLASLLKRAVTSYDMDALLHMVGRDTEVRRYGVTMRAEKLETQLRQFLIDSKMLHWDVESRIYKGSIGAPCPECGYRYGTAWLKRELPPEVVAWAQSFGEESDDDETRED